MADEIREDGKGGVTIGAAPARAIVVPVREAPRAEDDEKRPQDEDGAKE